MKKFSLISGLVAFLLLSSSMTSLAEVIDPTDVTASDCKRFGYAPADNTRSDDFETPSWTVSYNDGKLALVWHDFIANCCPDEGFGSRITLEGEKIIFEVWEVGIGMCDCYCPFDITSSYLGVAPGHYELVFRNWEKDLMTAEVDLKEGFNQNFNPTPSAVNSISGTDASLTVGEGVVTARCQGSFKVDIFNPQGVCVYSLNGMDEAQISIGSLRGGIFLVRLTPAAGEAVALPIIR